MWRLLSLLALCGMPALCADVCDSLPTWSPKWSAEHRSEPKYDLRPQSFQLSVRKGGPAFRITVRAFSPPVFGDPPIHGGDIEVARCRDGKQLQSLPIMAGNPIDFAASFHAEDINFDGYLDFSVLWEVAGSFESRSYWIYDPVSGLFVQNGLTRELSENCFAAAHGDCWHAYPIDFDPKKHEISTHHFGLGNSGCGAGADRYRVENNRLVLIHKEEITQRGSYLPRDCEVRFLILSAAPCVLRGCGGAVLRLRPLSHRFLNLQPLRYQSRGNRFRLLVETCCTNVRSMAIRAGYSAIRARHDNR
jgi:hypothetical protein